MGTRSCYREWLVLALLVAAMLAQIWTSTRELSVTSDEIDHLHAGYRYLQCADFGWNPEHPPLVKLIAALPLLGVPLKDPIPEACGLPSNRDLDFRRGHDFLFANPEFILSRARMATSVFAVLLLVTAYSFARDLFGTAVALITGTLIAFEPSLLGHGGLVTTDVPAAFGFMLVMYLTWIYLKKPGVLRIFGLGLALGVALIIKYSNLILLIIIPVLIVISMLEKDKADRLREALPRLGALLTVGLVAVAVIWSAYGFRYAARPHGAAPWTNDRIEQTRAIVPTRIIPMLQQARLLPEAYLIGAQDVLVEADLGRRAYLLGRNYLGGRWYYFPVASAIKLTIPFLAAVMLSIAALPFWRQRRYQLLFLFVPLALFMLASASSAMNIGFRHVFPIIPVAAIIAAAGAWNACSRYQSTWVIAILVGTHIASSLHTFPNYISYGNELWGGSAAVYKYLADSNADWGQAMKIARHYVHERKLSSCFIIHTYADLNSDYGIPCGDLSEFAHDIPPLNYTGTVIVSSRVVDGSLDRGSTLALARMFRGLRPTAQLGGSALLVYEGSFNFGSIIAERLVERVGIDIHAPQDVLDVTQIAVRLDATNLKAHRLRCQAYGYLGDFNHAQQECVTLYRLMEADPYSSQWEKSTLVRSMLAAGMTIPAT